MYDSWLDAYKPSLLLKLRIHPFVSQGIMWYLHVARWTSLIFPNGFLKVLGYFFAVRSTGAGSLV